MDGQLTAAIASAAISAAAAGIAIWQAVIARDQAATATEAAQLAERQAVAAEQQVKAAEDQVTLMRRQLDAEDAERQNARGPQFTIESGHTDLSDVNVPRGVLVLRQTSGPPLARVTVSASGQGVDGLRGDHTYDRHWDGYTRVDTAEIGPMASGGTATVYVDLDYHTHETTVTLHLDCQARNSPDVWQRSVAQDIEPRPERPAWMERRSR